MSRIGKLPISIPAGVTVNYDEASHVCTVKGPKALLRCFCTFVNVTANGANKLFLHNAFVLKLLYNYCLLN